MKNFLIISLLIFIFFFRCSNKKNDDYELFFNENKQQFQEVINIVNDSKYLIDSLNTINIIDCKKNKRFLKCDYCANEKLQKLFKQLNLYGVRITKGDEDCGVKNKYNEYEILLNAQNVSFIFSHCEYSYTSRSSTNILKKEIDKNWTILIEL